MKVTLGGECAVKRRCTLPSILALRQVPLALAQPDHFGDAGRDFSIDSLKSRIASFSSSSDVIESLLAGFKTSIGTGNDGHSTTLTGLLLQPLNASSKALAFRHAPRQYLFRCFIGFPLLCFAKLQRLDVRGIHFLLLPRPHGIFKPRLVRASAVPQSVRNPQQRDTPRYFIQEG